MARTDPIMGNPGMQRPVIAIISTGGTIARQAVDPRDTVDYAEIGTSLGGGDLLAALPAAVRARFDVRGIPFSSCDSVEMTLPRWFELAGVISHALATQPDLNGIVVTHGTSSLEEAACFLDLVLDVACPVVVVGAQRPASAISADGPANLFAALLVASAPQAAGRGVLVVANNEIHAAQEVTKASTYQLETFRSPISGRLAWSRPIGSFWPHVRLPPAHWLARRLRRGRRNPARGYLLQPRRCRWRGHACLCGGGGARPDFRGDAAGHVHTCRECGAG
ncbi:asparaginase domain-containing protein [Komagataeibacter rhaeticus]|nr:asparaginase domain-containing protein [Komagataeibacter rhaeticus]